MPGARHMRTAQKECYSRQLSLSYGACRLTRRGLVQGACLLAGSSLPLQAAQAAPAVSGKYETMEGMISTCQTGLYKSTISKSSCMQASKARTMARPDKSTQTTS